MMILAKTGESILISLVITVKLVINANSQFSNKRRHVMDAGCPEACSNKRRVSNKRWSYRSALDAGGEGSVNNI